MLMNVGHAFVSQSLNSGDKASRPLVPTRLTL